MTASLRFVEVNRISNWLQMSDSWKLLQTNCAGREASLKESSKRGGEFEAVSSLEVCFVVHMYRFGSSCLDETLFRHSPVLLHSCAVPEGGGMGGNE